MPSVEFLGEEFDVPDNVDHFAFLEFAEQAQGPGKVMDTWAAMYRVVKAVLREDDLPRFREVCSQQRPSEDALMAFAGRMMAAASGRPTSRPSDSSSGPRTTEPRSTDDSSSRVIGRLEETGRPDLALAVQRVTEGRRTA